MIKPMNEYELMFCIGSVVQWWDDLPPNLRQDIEGSGAEPGCIAKARALFHLYCRQNAVKAGRAEESILEDARVDPAAFREPTTI